MSKSQNELQKLMRHRRVFITGGSGFVGRNLIRYYRSTGAEVRVLTRSDAADQRVAEAGGNPDGESTALPQLTEAVNKGKFAWISNGNYLTSTTHIENLCQGISRAAEYGRNGEIYFITDGTPHVFRDFVSALLATQGLSAPSKSVPRRLIRLFAQLGDGLNRLTAGRIQSPLNMQVFATSAVEVSLDITKAKNELGYKPLVSLNRGLELMRK